jgi:hypothetical protein
MTIRQLLVAAAAAALLAWGISRAAAQSCPPEPPKPPPPAGCKDLRSYCECERDEKTGVLKCAWRFRCIPY